MLYPPVIKTKDEGKTTHLKDIPSTDRFSQWKAPPCPGDKHRMAGAHLWRYDIQEGFKDSQCWSKHPSLHITASRKAALL